MTSSFIKFIVFVILFWVSWVLNIYTWPYAQHDTLNRIADSAMPILIVMIMILGVFIMRLMLKGDGKSSKHRLLKSIVVISNMLLIIGTYSFLMYKYQSAGLQTGGITSIESKEYIDGKYYFYVKRETGNYTENVEYPEYLVKIKCDKYSYDRIILDKDVEYVIDYRTSMFTNKEGFLLEIDLENYIDNRGILEIPEAEEID